MQYFLLGIPEGELLREVMKPPTAADYQALKQRAVEHATASQGYRNIVQIQRSLYGQAQNLGFQYGQQRGPRRGFFYRGDQGNPSWRSRETNLPQYNSSNTPRSMNNQPVPMDIGRSRAGYRRGRGGRGGGRGGFRSNATNVEGQTSNACFNCGVVGHFACNCPNKRNQSTRAATVDDDETIANEETTDRVAWIKSELASLSQEETTHLADELEPSQDFPNA